MSFRSKVQRELFTLLDRRNPGKRTSIVNLSRHIPTGLHLSVHKRTNGVRSGKE